MKDGERLAKEEVELFLANICPDCKSAGFILGPWGGLSQNVTCSSPNCGSKFNRLGPHAALGVERISDKSPLRGVA